MRLARPEFSFGEAAPGGTDLRFTTMDGVVLQHVVEAWDSAAGYAEIGVRLKVRDGGGYDSLRMDWGNLAALFGAGSVFDSVYGYAGLWHLNEKTSGGVDPLEDSGPFALRTSAVALVPEFQGVFGTSQRFDGIGAYAAVAAVEEVRTTAHLSVSAWIAADTTGMPKGSPGEAWTILSNWKESDSTGFILSYLPNAKCVRLILGFGGKVTRLEPILGGPVGEWHLVGATYDGTEAAVYTDGAQVTTWPAGPGDLPLPSREYLIGARGAVDPNAAKADFFRGNIDEARVFHSIPWTWPSLDFKAQQPGSNFLRFQKVR